MPDRKPIFQAGDKGFEVGTATAAGDTGVTFPEKDVRTIGSPIAPLDPVSFIAGQETKAHQISHRDLESTVERLSKKVEEMEKDLGYAMLFGKLVRWLLKLFRVEI